MHNLIVYQSPLSQSFTAKIAHRLKDIFEERGETVCLRDLEAVGFNPVITEKDIVLSQKGKYPDDVLAEQKLIAAADHITLVFPLYQLSMPALMKGYIDRAWSQGFAYNYGENGRIIPCLTGKSVAIYIPMGASVQYAESAGHIKAVNHIMRNTFEFRGLTVKSIQYFDHTDRAKQLAALN